MDVTLSCREHESKFHSLHLSANKRWEATNLCLFEGLHGFLALRLDVPTLDGTVDRAAHGDRRILVVPNAVHRPGVTPADHEFVIIHFTFV